MVHPQSLAGPNDMRVRPVVGLYEHDVVVHEELRSEVAVVVSSPHERASVKVDNHWFAASRVQRLVAIYKKI